MTHDEIDQFSFFVGSDQDCRRALFMTDGQRVVELMDDRNVRQGSFDLLASAPSFYKANTQMIIGLQTMMTVVDAGEMSQELMLDVLTQMQNKAMKLQRIAIFGAEAVVAEANAQARTGKRK